MGEDETTGDTVTSGKVYDVQMINNKEVISHLKYLCL